MNTHTINSPSLDSNNDVKIKKPKKQWKGIPASLPKGRSVDSLPVMNGGGVGTSEPFNPAWFPPVDYVPSPNQANDGGPADNLGGGFPSTYEYEILCNEPSHDDDKEDCSCFPNHSELAAFSGTAGNSVDFSVEFGHFPQFQGMPSGRISIHALNLDDNLLDGSLTFFDHPSQRRICAILQEEQCVAVMTARGHMRFGDFSQGYAAKPFGGSELFTSRLFMVNEDGTPFSGPVEKAPCFEEVFKTGMVIRYNPIDGRPIFIRTDMGRQISAEELLGELAVIRVDKDGDWVHYEEILHSLHGSDHIQKDRIRQVWSRSDGLLDFPDASTINWYSPLDVLNHLGDDGFFVIRDGASPIKEWKFEKPENHLRSRAVDIVPELAVKESHGSHETQSRWSPFSEDGTCFIRGTGKDAECSVKIREVLHSSTGPFRRPNGFVQNVAGRASKLVSETKYSFKGEPGSLNHPLPPEGDIETITRNVYESRESGDVLLSKTEGLNSPLERTWSYEYGQDPASPNFGKKTKIITPEGKETEMEYDEDGNLIFKREPWLINSIRETKFSYMHEKNNDRRIASSCQTVVGADGVEVVLEQIDYQYEESPLVCRKTVTTHALGVASPQVQITETYGTGAEDFKIGKIFRTIGPDGLEVIYDYVRTDEMGAELKTVRSILKAGMPVPGLSSRTITFTDSRGDIFKTINQIHDGINFATVSERTMIFDELHRVVRTSYGDGRAENTEWTCFGPLWQTDADGIQTRYFYNAANRLIRQEMDAVPLLENYNAPHDTAQKPMRVYEYEYDGSGNRIATVERIGELVKRSSQKLDSLSRSIEMTDEMGRVTSISYSSDGLTQTTVLAGGAIKTTRNSPDGFLVEESLSNGPSRYYSYEMTTEGLVTTSRSGSPSGPVIEQSVQDGLGRVIKTLRPTADGSGEMITEKVAYDERGFVSSRQIDGMAPILMEYDELGNQSKNVVKRSPLSEIDLAVDRVVETTILHSTLPEGTPGLPPELANSAVFKQTKKRRHFSDENSNGISTEESVWVLESEVEGITDAGIESLTISKDKYGNWGWKRAENHFGNKRIYIKTPFSSIETEQVIVDSELIREVNEAGIPRFTARRYTSSGGILEMTDASCRKMTHELDPFGRRLKMTDTLGNHVETEYDPVTGLVSSTVDADGQDSRFLYDSAGRLTEQFGTASLSLRRAYDDVGNLSSITMWRNVLSGAEEENSGDITRWDHDPITGKIIRKTYADGFSVSFSYDRYGRLASRTSAKGIVSSYSYRNLTGELVSVSHSDGSPGMEFSYFGDGRLSQLSDASGITSFEYDDYGDIALETTEGFIWDLYT